MPQFPMSNAFRKVTDKKKSSHLDFCARSKIVVKFLSFYKSCKKVFSFLSFGKKFKKFLKVIILGLEKSCPLMSFMMNSSTAAVLTVLRIFKEWLTIGDENNTRVLYLGDRQCIHFWYYFSCEYSLINFILVRHAVVPFQRASINMREKSVLIPNFLILLTAVLMLFSPVFLRICRTESLWYKFSF